MNVFCVRATVLALLALLLHADWDPSIVGPRHFLICLPGLLFLPLGVFWIFALLFVFIPLVDEVCTLTRAGGGVHTQSYHRLRTTAAVVRMPMLDYDL